MLIKIWEELHNIAAGDILVQLKHVKAHRTKRENRCRTLRSSSLKANEKADEWAKKRAMLDEGFMAEARAKTMQQEREEVYAAVQYAASFHCLVEEWKDCDELNQVEAERKVDFRGPEKRGDETSNGVVC